MSNYYAQLDANNVVFAVTDLHSPETASNLISINSYDTTLIGKTYDSVNKVFNYTFAQQQQNKISELQQGYASAFATFQSSALGSVHTYPIDTEAENNFKKWTQLLTLNSNISTVQFKTLENGMTDHTRAQFIQVLTDLSTFEVTQAKKFETKDSQRKTCTATNNQLSSIVWNDTTAPSAPTGLTGTPGTGSANLSWTTNSEIDVQVGGSYNVYKAGAKLANVTTNSYTATGLTSGTAISFTVSAVDSDGNESPQSASVTVTPT